MIAWLDPSPDDARTWLRRELLRPEYQERDVVGRLVRWVERQLNRLLDAASDVPPLSALTAMAVTVLLLAAAGWAISRLRRAGRARPGSRPVLVESGLTSADLRERALSALAGQRPADAVVDAFRALVSRQVERGQLDDVPGATAWEAALALESVHGEGRGISEAAHLFDAVLYGARPATVEQAEWVLALDAELAGSSAPVPAVAP